MDGKTPGGTGAGGLPGGLRHRPRLVSAEQGGLAAGESFPVASFSAGDLAVRRNGPNAVSRSLEAQAEAIMGPYVQDGDFAFLEVMG